MKHPNARTSPTLLLEHEYLTRGYRYVVGVDEAGRGPWAGPVCAGAVMVEHNSQQVPGVRDSKFLLARARHNLYDTIVSQSISHGVATIDARTIDTFGIQQAVHDAMSQAVMKCIQSAPGATIENTFVLVDGSKTMSLQGCQSIKILRGGALHYSISAGSILAKVTRDLMMGKLHKLYPQYGFDVHKGYGTKQHQEALAKWGPCPIHRQSYAPIARLKSLNDG